jgi:alanyl-tRNA synthetase
MLRKIVINGREYEVGRNYDVGESIKKNYGEYKLGVRQSGFVTDIMFKSNNYFDKEIKNIGSLIYDEAKDIITYQKYINESHIMRVNNTIGLNYDVIQNLAVKDKIKIIQKDKNETIFRTMSVRKALTYEDFKQYKSQGYERQIFVPVDDFKTLVSKRG